MRFAAGFVVVLVCAAASAAQDTPPPIEVHRATGPIHVDGDLSDPGWKDAAVIEDFWETQPGDNVPPKVVTRALLAYDEKYLYIGIDARDPHPEAIRAPFVDRDQVIGTDDNIAVFLDTRNDRRSAIEVRVNPRGSQGDARLRPPVKPHSRSTTSSFRWSRSSTCVKRNRGSRGRNP